MSITSSYYNLERMAGFPAQYSPSVFFTQYCGAFLPLIYRETAEELSSVTRVNFFRMWAWESENILRELGIEESLGDTQEYATRSREHSYPGMSYRLSEIYRSAFLRALAWFHAAGDLSDEAFRQLSVMTVPIDLSLWEVGARSAPQWWPQSTRQEGVQNAKSEDTIATLWPDIRSLVDINVNEPGESPRRILAAQGPLLLEELHQENNASVSFRLIGFAYKVVGPKVPSPREVERLISTSYGGPKSHSSHVLSVLDALKHDSVGFSPYSWKSKDSLEVTSLLSRLEPEPTSTWQWYRFYGRPLILSPFFRMPGESIVVDASSWNYSAKGALLAKFYDWRSGALEKDSLVVYPRHGNVAEVDSNWLSTKLEERGLKLGHVLRIDLRLQKRSYEETKTHTHIELIGVSKLISDSNLGIDR